MREYHREQFSTHLRGYNTEKGKSENKEKYVEKQIKTRIKKRESLLGQVLGTCY